MAPAAASGLWWCIRRWFVRGGMRGHFVGRPHPAAPVGQALAQPLVPARRRQHLLQFMGVHPGIRQHLPRQIECAFRPGRQCIERRRGGGFGFLQASGGVGL